MGFPHSSAVGEQVMLTENKNGLRQVNPRAKSAALRLEDGLEVTVTRIERCRLCSGTDEGVHHRLMSLACPSRSCCNEQAISSSLLSY